MVKPRVLVSSTCHDLRHIREQLRDLINNIGYEAVLSEEGDIYYHPDLHLHLSCIREVEFCNLVILIIGASFGTESTVTKDKSVTHEEIDEAHLRHIPIITFIDRRVLHDYKIYSEVVRDAQLHNKDVKEAVVNTKFGVVGDPRIFKFIDDVINKTDNNIVFEYSDFKEIEEKIKKQWAGMVYANLKREKEKAESDKIMSLLSRLQIASEKVEQKIDIIANKPMDSDINLSSINKDAETKRLTLIFSEIWECFLIDQEFMTKGNIISDDLIDRINRILFDQSNAHSDRVRNLNNYLIEVELVDRSLFHINYRVDYLLPELRETVERYQISDEIINEVMRLSLSRAVIEKGDLRLFL